MKLDLTETGWWFEAGPLHINLCWYAGNWSLSISWIRP